MLWLILLFGYLRAGVLGPICEDFAIECQEQTCTPDAFDGAVVDDTFCPFVRAADDTINRECTACISGYTCTSSGECVLATSLAGKPCSVDEQCRPFVPDISELPLSCVGGQCVPDKTGLLLPGDSGCSSNSDCFGASTCAAGSCVGSFLCSSDKECEPGKYCDAICRDVVETGSNCDTSSQCPITQICQDAQCVNRFTYDFDEVCGNDPISIEFGCSPGLQCIQVGMTEEYRCEPTPASGNPCNVLTTGQCPTGQECDCDPVTGRGTCRAKHEDGRCATQWRNYFQCAQSSDCRWENYENIFPGTCIREECFSEWASLQECRYPTADSVIRNLTCEVTRRAQIKSGNVIAPLDDFDAAAMLENIFY